MERPYGRLDAVFGAIIAAGIFILVTLGAIGVSHSAVLTANPPGDPSCVGVEEFLSDLEGRNQDTDVHVARDIKGDAANEFALLTGWNGEKVARAVLVVGINQFGAMYPTAYVALVNSAGCVIAVGQFPAEDAGRLMTTLEERHQS